MIDPAIVDKITKVISDFVPLQEEVGDNSSKSGHIATISVDVNEIDIKPEEKSSYKYRVEVKYTKMIESEFTYYPDNPPQEYIYNQIVFIDTNFTVVGFYKKELISSNWDIDKVLKE